jgi:hypothetical protein
MAYNGHAKGYMWKRLGVLLDMSMTLEANGVKDETAQFEKLGMNEEDFLPAIHLYFRYVSSSSFLDTHELNFEMTTAMI